MSTADTLQAVEICERRGQWATAWEPKRLPAVRLLAEGVRAGLLESERKDFGEVAGETVMELANDRGMEMPASRNLHDSVVHHAALADMLTCAIRKPGTPAWKPVPETTLRGHRWASSALMSPDGTELRRLVFATAWSDDRHYAEIRSWYGMGETTVYEMPMTQIVYVLGQHRDGRRQGPFTRGFQHPKNRVLRFRKRSKAQSEVFSDSWQQIWREDHGEISNAQWLQAMLDDDILRDVCFTVPISVPSAADRQKIRDMADRKLYRLARARDLPEPSLSVCDRPRCPFLDVCLNIGPTVGPFVPLRPILDGQTSPSSRTA